MREFTEEILSSVKRILVLIATPKSAEYKIWEKDLWFCDFILLANYGWRSFLRHAIDIEHTEKRPKIWNQRKLGTKDCLPKLTRRLWKSFLQFSSKFGVFSEFPGKLMVWSVENLVPLIGLFMSMYDVFKDVLNEEISAT